jgi:ABC-2 type transport system permease protein
VMASVFALGRSTRIFQQTLTYPFYVLGGVIVPVALLPAWVRPLSRAVFLSWTADLLRDALQPSPVENVGGRLLGVVALGAAALAVGGFLLDRVMRRVRRTGTMGYA